MTHLKVALYVAKVSEQSYTIKLQRVDANLLFVEQNSNMRIASDS